MSDGRFSCYVTSKSANQQKENPYRGPNAPVPYILTLFVDITRYSSCLLVNLRLAVFKILVFWETFFLFSLYTLISDCLVGVAPES